MTDDDRLASGDPTPAGPTWGDVPPVLPYVAPVSPPREVPWSAPPGFEVLGELGRGGMGVVHKARQVELDRVVALKLIRGGELASAAERERFRAEAQAAARLQHPNIVQVHQVGEHAGQPYLVLEYVAGGSLADRLGQGPLPSEQAAALVEALARAAQAAHEAGVIHRDLKPGNVLLTPDGAPKVTDFGLARRLDAEGARQTQTGAVVGTPAYMAPEQARGEKEVGPLADIWALGAILYECLIGRPPFRAATPLDTILQVVSTEPVPPRQLNPQVPRDLETVALKCLDKSPARRYATANELADDLARWRRGDPVQARRTGLFRRLWRRTTWKATALLLLAFVFTGVGVRTWWMWKTGREEQVRQAVARADKLREAGQLVEAVEAYTEAIRLAPREAETYSKRAWTRHLLGDNGDAEADWAESLRLDPTAARTYQDRGVYWLRRGRWREAADDLTQVLELAPDRARVWGYRGGVYLHLRQWDRARADLDEAIRLEADLPRPFYEPYYLRSTLNAVAGDWSGAQADFERYARLSNPRPRLAISLFTEAVCALGRRDEARYRRARDRLVANAEASASPDDDLMAARACALPAKWQVPLSRVGPLLARGLKAGGKKLGRDQFWYGRALALVWLRTGRAEDALRELRRGLNDHPSMSPGLNHLVQALALKELKRDTEARQALKQAIDTGPPVHHPHEAMEYQLLLREARQQIERP